MGLDGVGILHEHVAVYAPHRLVHANGLTVDDLPMRKNPLPTH